MAGRRVKAVTTENAQRRSDMAFLRTAMSTQTPQDPFDPCMVAPYSAMPLWRFAHALCWENHDKAAASAQRQGKRKDETPSV